MPMRVLRQCLRFALYLQFQYPSATQEWRVRPLIRHSEETTVWIGDLPDGIARS